MNYLIKIAITLFALAFLTFMGFGVVLTSIMESHGMVESSCPYMPGESGMCAMNLLDHLAGWQGITVATVGFSIVLLLFVVVSAIGGFGCRLNEEKPLVLRRSTDPPWQLWQPLRVALATGIIQPKLF